MQTTRDPHDTKLFGKANSNSAGLVRTSLGELTLLQAVLDNAPAVVYLKDVQGRYVMINRCYEELFRLKRKDVWGKSDHDLFPKQVADAFRANDRRVLEEQRPLEFEEVAPQKSEFRTYISVKFPLYDGNGVPQAVCGISTDITERKASEEKLKRAYEDLARNGEVLRQTLDELKASHEELKQTQLDLIQAAKLESVGTLAAGVAHEVKNPLQTILMGLAFLSSNLPADNKVVTETLGRMRDAVKRANFIISELLQLSSATDLILAEEDIHDLLDRVLELMQYELNASVVNVERHYHAQARRVRVDRTRMEQVLINIFLNAIQAMSHHGVLSVQTRSGRVGQEFPLGESPFNQFQPGDTLVVTEVKDTGSGIPQGIRSKIFDPFFTTKPVGIGTGLGLSVMKKIIDLHSGAVNIQNHPDGGAVVTLVLQGLGGGVS